MWSRLLNFYLDLPFPVKLIASLLLTAFVGSSLMAFLSTYANYLFAFRHGARIPVEGVPFLSLSVAIASSAILFGATACIAVVWCTMWSIAPKQLRRAPHLLGPATWRRKLFILVMFVVCNAASLELIFFGVNQLDNAQSIRQRFGLPPDLNYMANRELYFVLFAVMMNFLWIGLVLVMFPAHVNRNFSLVYGAITVIMIGGMFLPGTYDSFLRLARFGGGIEVTLAKKDGQSLNSTLFLMTEKRAILYDARANTFMEIPADDIASITYELHPNWKLPNTSVWDQLKYVK